jgi:hypothetical protein
MKQKHQDSSTPKSGTPETSGDGILKDLAAKAKALAPALSEATDGDPRRRGNIEIVSSGNRHILRVDKVVWAEIEWSQNRRAWCIQDHCGYCLHHVEHLHVTMPNEGNPNPTTLSDLNPQPAIERAKQMIRDGSMPSPDDAKKAFRARHGREFTNWEY